MTTGKDPVPESELRATVDRMEARLTSNPAPALRASARRYATLVTRFEADLAASPRDVLLAKASALMLVQQEALDLPPPGAAAVVEYRPGQAADALCVAVLATHVFLDTYTTAGLRPDLAREALSVYSPEAFAARLADPALRFVLAERSGHLVAFAQVAMDRPCPAPVRAEAEVEVVRLYVHPRFQHQGIGRALMLHAERIAAGRGAGAVWLAAWAGNTRALAFYRALGYEDVGASTYAIEGQDYENRVLRKGLPTG
jgi:ribosomal protein S18 acetylase RimI-like enzyme